MIDIDNAELNTSIMQGVTTFFADFSGVITLVVGIAFAVVVVELILSFFDKNEGLEDNENY